MIRAALIAALALPAVATAAAPAPDSTPPASPCAPPHTVNVKRGGHVFTVAAIDTAENIDSTPAEYSWKVRKRTDRR